jgi:hypothetical protein
MADPKMPNENASDWADLAKNATGIERTLVLLEQHMSQSSKYGDDLSKIFKSATTDLKTMVALSESVEEAIKGMSAQSKKYQQAVLKSKTWEDQREALKAMQAGFKQMQAQYATIPKMSKVAERGFRDCADALKEMEHRTGEMGEDLIGAQKTLKGLTSDFDHLAKTVKGIEFGHMTRQLHGMSKALGAAGLGGKTHAYATKGAEMAAKMRELTKERTDANKSAFMSKRKDALADVEAKYGKDTASPARAAALRKAMGVSWFNRKKFAAAEMAGGGEEAFGGLATHGGGMGGMMMSRAAGTVESGIGMMGGAMAKAAPVLAVLEALRMAFDKTVEQNKEMESGLGKGGLFTAKAGSAGFMQARQGLTPGGFGFTQMGLSFERNLKMAQAVVEGGYNIAELVTGERGKGAAGSQYMPGALGQFQQIAVGAGRVAGMGDAEGIQQTVKLLGQYRMTLETSNQFFVTVAKDSKAAGLSTTKYIQILDEASNHFDRMNKSMSESVNILRMLGRTGSIAGDDMQTMMDFFTQGSKTTFDTVAPKVFTSQQMTGGMRDSLIDAHRTALQTSLDAAGDSLKKIPSMGALKSGKDLEAMGIKQANAYLTDMESQIASAKVMGPDGKMVDVDDITKQTNRSGLEAVRGYMQRLISQKGGAMSRAASQSIYGSDIADTMADNLTQVMSSSALAGGGLMKLMSGGMNAQEELGVQGVLEKVYGQGDPKASLDAFKQSQRNAAMGRIQDVQGNPKEAKALVGELLRLPGFKEEYKTKGYTMSLKEAAKDSAKFLKENANKLGESVSYLGTTADWQVKQAAKDQKPTKGDMMQAEKMGKVIGMQTQTSADVIANAFSTWFNDIIGFLGKITMGILKPSKADIAATAAIFDNTKLQKAAVRAQEVMGKRQDELAAQMASGKLSDEDFASAQKEYKALGDKLDDIAKYSSDDAKKTASLSDATDYQNEILGAIKDPTKQAHAEMNQRKIFAQIGKTAGVQGPRWVGDSETVPTAMWSQVSSMPGVADALKSGALTQKATAGGVQITVNNNYNASYDPSTQGSDSAGTPGSSGEASKGHATPTT